MTTGFNHFRFVYCIGAVENWAGMQTWDEWTRAAASQEPEPTEEEEDGPVDGAGQRRQLLSEAFALARRARWTDVMRGGESDGEAPYVMVAPVGDFTFKAEVIALVWKQDRNDRTIVVSKHELPWLGTPEVLIGPGPQSPKTARRAKRLAAVRLKETTKPALRYARNCKRCDGAFETNQPVKVYCNVSCKRRDANDKWAAKKALEGDTKET